MDYAETEDLADQSAGAGESNDVQRNIHHYLQKQNHAESPRGNERPGLSAIHESCEYGKRDGN